MTFLEKVLEILLLNMELIYLDVEYKITTENTTEKFSGKLQILIKIDPITYNLLKFLDMMVEMVDKDTKGNYVVELKKEYGENDFNELRQFIIDWKRFIKSRISEKLYPLDIVLYQIEFITEVWKSCEYNELKEIAKKLKEG